MIRLSYDNMWMELAKIEEQKGITTVARTYWHIIQEGAFDNCGVLLPDEWEVKR